MFNVEYDLSTIKNIEQVSLKKILIGLIRLANDIVNDLKRETPSGVSHFLKHSITMIPANLDISNTERNLLIYIGAPGVKYALPFFFGSRPHWPPYLALVDWVKLRGFGVELSKDPVRRAYILAASIAKKGTKSHEYILENVISKYKNQLGRYIQI